MQRRVGYRWASGSAVRLIACAVAVGAVMWLAAVAVPSVASAQSPLTVAGPWHDLANGYTKGDSTSEEFSLCVDRVEQPGWIAVEEVGVGEVWGSNPIPPSRAQAAEALAQEEPSSCPTTVYSYAGWLDSTVLTEGAHTFQAIVNDREMVSEPWTVSVDRSAPAFPSTFTVGGRPSAPGTIWVYWDGADDPALADGTAGSGVGRYEVRLPGGSWLPEDGGGIQIAEPSSATTIEVRAYDRAGNVSSAVSAPVTMLATDPEDSVAPDVSVPQPGDDEWDADAPGLSQDRQDELEEYYGDEDAGSGLAPFGDGQALLRGLAAPYPPTGTQDPDLRYRCVGPWAPIQAQVSGFVLGNCRGDEWVLGYKGYVKPVNTPVEDWPGAPSEGRGWEAVSLPAAAHFDGCGWINIKNRLYDPQSDPPPLVNRCDAGPVADRVHQEVYDHGEFIKSYAGTRIAPFEDANSKKYANLYIWASFGTKGGRRVEMSGKKYVPTFGGSNDSTKFCQAYANINPYKSGQHVLENERTFAVHDNSPNIRLRYLARFRAYDEAGHLNSWVMLHSVSPTDRLQNWGFVSANCLFTD